MISLKERENRKMSAVRVFTVVEVMVKGFQHYILYYFMLILTDL